MPDSMYGLSRGQIHQAIGQLTDNLVQIHDDSGEFFFGSEGFTPVNDKSWDSWNWTQGVGLYGLYRYFELTRDEKTLGIIRDWFDRRFAEGTVEKNVNSMAPLLTMIYLAEETGDKKYRPYIDQWLEWVMHDMTRTDEDGLQHTTVASPNRQQLWADTLMMTVMPLARGGKLLGRPEYINEARKQFLLHIRYLADKKTGLWYHGWNFKGHHNFAGAFWARGNCWATITITDFLELLNLPEGDYYREYLRTVLHAQIDALSNCQCESGLWHTVLNDAGTYEEASAAAGFAYGILKAVRRHYVDASYAQTGIRAIKAILANIGPDGTLAHVSVGTPVFNSAAEYNQVAVGPMPYGQSLAIMCLSECLRGFI